MTPLETRRAQVAYLTQRGHAPQEIEGKLGLTSVTIHNDLQAIRAEGLELPSYKMNAKHLQGVSDMEIRRACVLMLHLMAHTAPQISAKLGISRHNAESDLAFLRARDLTLSKGAREDMLAQNAPLAELLDDAIKIPRSLAGMIRVQAKRAQRTPGEFVANLLQSAILNAASGGDIDAE